MMVGTDLTVQVLVDGVYCCIEVTLEELKPWNNAYTTSALEGAQASSMRCQKLVGFIMAPVASGVMLTQVPVLPVLTPLATKEERYIPPLLPVVPRDAYMSPLAASSRSAPRVELPKTGEPSTCVQVVPPSVDLCTPAALAPTGLSEAYKWPLASINRSCTYRKVAVDSNLFQVTPPSILFHIPSPCTASALNHPSPVPKYIVFGVVGFCTKLLIAILSK